MRRLKENCEKLKIISFVGSGALLTKAVQFAIDNDFSVEKVFCPKGDSGIPILDSASVSYFEVDNNRLAFYINQWMNEGFESGIIFSVNNRFIFSDEILEKLSVPVINIHNGLVQSYRGVAEICVLAALCNHELQYGATCHQILPRQEVDTGRVLLQKSFNIEIPSYAWLMSKSVKNCQEIFEEVLLRIISESWIPSLQVNFSEEPYTYASILDNRTFRALDLEAVKLGIYSSIFPKIENFIKRRKMRDQVLIALSAVRPEFDFAESESFIEDGLLDSFDLISLVTYLDKEFGISIEGIDIVPENFMSLNSIERMLNKYVS